MNTMTELKNLRIPLELPDGGGARYRQLEIEYDPDSRSMWTYLKPAGTACFNLGLLSDLRSHDRAFELSEGNAAFNGEIHAVDYAILASRSEHLFNYGGDLALFILLIKARDRDALLHYARLCIDCVYARIVNYHTPAVTISLVQGDALGGGFEYALASDVIIAEEGARMGFPEILFNLFPGMGAYSLLARRLGSRMAEKMILGGRIYGAQELHALGLIDMLVAKGEGENAVRAYMRDSGKRLNGLRAVYRCRHHAQPISREELMKITELWVDAALRLKDRDLKMMGRLARAQLRQQELRRKGLPIEDDSNWAREEPCVAEWCESLIR